jgi:hypothetical protein
LAVEGGEFNNGAGIESNRGAIYDPLTNTWTMVSPPNGGTGFWARIGDAPAEVLADGRWLIGTAVSADYAILDPATLTWTANNGDSKTDASGEAGFTLLPDGKVLSVDVMPPACTTRTTEAFDPATLLWSSAGSTPTPLVACGDWNEIGPQLMTYGAKVFAEGATPATALYDVTTGTWSSGPSLPIVGGDQQDASDAGSALLPDGNMLLLSRTGDVNVNGGRPTHFFLFDGTSLTQAPEYPTSDQGGLGYMLLLPTGQVLYNGWPGGLRIFTDPGPPNPAWAPALTGVYPGRLAAGVTYQLTGTQLNGLSDGAAFGDDYQSSTDYPLVQITNDGTGAVAYARTSRMTNRSIAPHAPSCTDFTLPNGIATGPSELRVIANGIASAAYPIIVGAGGSNTHLCPSYTLSTAKAGSGSGTMTSFPSGIDCGATCSHAYPNGTFVTLTAAPVSGSAFAGWSGGGCSGTAACVVSVTGDTPVTATFTHVPETLDVSTSGDGAGAVTSSPAGIDCGTSCSHAYDYGSSVTLSALAARGSSFGGWSGDCAGTASCVITMTGEHSLDASFVKDCVVPKLKGKTLKAAKRALRAHDCSAGTIKRAFSNRVKKGRVISQKPKPRKRLKHGAKVKLTVSKGKKP